VLFARKVHKHTVAKEKQLLKSHNSIILKRVLFTNLIQRQGKLNLNQRFNSKFSQRNSKTTNNPTKNTLKTHAVLPKETIYGIAKQYDVSVAECTKLIQLLKIRVKKRRENNNTSCRG
jgi:LysM repeat protein